MEINLTWALGIFFCGRDSVQFASFEYKTPFDNFEVQIASNLSVHQYFYQLAWNKHTFGD